MNFETFTNAPLVIQLHAWAAFIALGLGIAMWLRPKGTKSHKAIGRGFLLFMLIAALSAIFIREINDGQFSWIHIFVPVTLFASFEAVFYIRKGNLKGHKRAVKGMFFGALLIPGAFSFLPGRLMWQVFFG